MPPRAWNGRRVRTFATLSALSRRYLKLRFQSYIQPIGGVSHAGRSRRPQRSAPDKTGHVFRVGVTGSRLRHPSAAQLVVLTFVIGDLKVCLPYYLIGVIVAIHHQIRDSAAFSAR
jgi:hypothetical protein